MKTANLKTISDDLNKYDYCAKEDSFISITEWENGEGYNITIDDRVYAFTRGELDAIWYLVKSIDYAS